MVDHSMNTKLYRVKDLLPDRQRRIKKKEEKKSWLKCYMVQNSQLRRHWYPFAVFIVTMNNALNLIQPMKLISLDKLD